MSLKSFFKRNNNQGAKKGNLHFIAAFVLAPAATVVAVGAGIAVATGAAATIGAAAAIGAVTFGGLLAGSLVGTCVGVGGHLLDKKFNHSANHHGFSSMGRFYTATFLGSLAIGLGGAYGGYKLGVSLYGDNKGAAKTAFNTVNQATPAVSANTLVLTAKDFALKA